MKQKPLEIRNDDVLQENPASEHQSQAIEKKSLFKWFLEADKVFEKYNYPCTLVVLSEGIDTNPEWVQYIKNNMDRYKIELHGSGHFHYNQLSENMGYEELREAKEIIENTFNVKLTTWYVPYGRRCVPEWGNKVCKRLKIKMDVPKFKCLPKYYGQQGRKQINFHYWNVAQVERVNNIIKEICTK